MKINLAVDLDIHAFQGSGITEYESGMRNCMVHREGDRISITQRPSIDVTEDASDITGLLDRGRGIYYWEQNSKLYIVNDDSVYASTQNSAAVGTISTGTERVTILETIGTPRLVILDAENDEGYYMSTGEVVTQIASNFPTTLCHGGAILDSYVFVMDEDGLIYNSNADDPTTWGALDFLEAERENDKGVYLGKHHDHIVAFGTRTIEFFYNANNSTGSPLNRRQDISYNIGCVSGTAVWETGDIIYFLGSDTSGQIQCWKLENFQLSIVSTDTISSYLTRGLTQEDLKIVMSGFTAMGFQALNIFVYTLTGTAPGEIFPKQSLVYCQGLWQFWCTQVDSLSCFPLTAFTKRTGGQNPTVAARTGEGIMYNGDIISVNDNLVPIDTIKGTAIYEDGVFEPDIYVNISTDTGTNIQMVLRTGMQDAGTYQYKFQNVERLVMESTSTAQTMTIKHADEVNTFDAGNTIDLSNERKEIHQGGRFTKRNYQLEFSGDQQIFIDSFDVELEAGT